MGILLVVGGTAAIIVPLVTVAASLIAVTLLAGIVIYEHFPENAQWVIGLLIGLEMLFNGWSWIMLAIGLRNLPVQEG